MYKIKIIKSKLPTYWYSKHIGETFYAIDYGQDLKRVTEYGVKMKMLFDRDDLEILEKDLKFINRRIFNRK